MHTVQRNLQTSPKPSDVTPQETLSLPKVSKNKTHLNRTKAVSHVNLRIGRIWKLQDLKGKNGRTSTRIGEP